MLPTAENRGSRGATTDRTNGLKQNWPPWRRPSIPRSADLDDGDGATYIPLTDFRSSTLSPKSSASNSTRLVPASPAHAQRSAKTPSAPAATTITATTITTTTTATTDTAATPTTATDPSPPCPSLSWSSCSSTSTTSTITASLPNPSPRPPHRTFTLKQRQRSQQPNYNGSTSSLAPSHVTLGAPPSLSPSRSNAIFLRNLSEPHATNNNHLAEQSVTTSERATRDGPSPPAFAVATTLPGQRSEGEPQKDTGVWPRRLGRRHMSDGGMQKPAAQYMRGIATEARAWTARTLAPAGSGSNNGGKPKHGERVDPVTMLLLVDAGDQRVGGPSGRGPLLRRLQQPAPGMLDDFVVVTITRPGQLYVRLKPDPRGLVIVNNFDRVPDDPDTGCPRLGPVEIVGSVMPGDALASANREVLIGRPFAESVKCIKDASASATVADPCLLCFRKADPTTLKAGTQAAPPRSLEQEKRRSLEALLRGGEDGMLDEAKLRGITSTGVPDAGGLRPVLWRFLLRCLPLSRHQWSDHLKQQRDLYARFVNDLILKPAEKVTQGGGFAHKSALLLTGADLGKLVLGDEAAGGTHVSAAIAADIAAAEMNGRTKVPKEGVDAPERRVGARSDLPVPTKGETRADREVSPETTTATSPVSASSPTAAAAPQRQTRNSGKFNGNHELIRTDDDPLSDKESSGWAALWSDKELMQAIEQDVVRTMPDLAFYAGGGGGGSDEDEADGGRNGGGSGKSKARSEKHRLGHERHLAIARILFVHAKLNPAESYTQGMNEIVATLFFVMGNDPHEEWSRHAEADTFFCFTNLMAEIRDVFIQSLDESESGLQGKMEAFSRTLRQHDPELADHMVSLALDPRYYALRWFTTLLCREFDLPDTIRLWDSFFASRDRSTFLVFLFVTLLLAQREALLAGDFASDLQLLQAYPPTDIPEILARSEALRLFSARGDAARTRTLTEQRGREAAEGAKAAAEHVNAAARRLWNAATDFATEVAAGAAETMERMAIMTEGHGSLDLSDSGGRYVGGVDVDDGIVEGGDVVWRR